MFVLFVVVFVVGGIGVWVVLIEIVGVVVFFGIVVVESNIR